MYAMVCGSFEFEIFFCSVYLFVALFCLFSTFHTVFLCLLAILIAV
jgi:predicted RND superfamily exporter protein